MSSYPRLIIKYAFPLDANRRQLYRQNNWPDYPAFHQITKQIEHWRSLWAETNHNDRIIELLSNVTGLYPADNFTLFVIGRGLPPMSQPFIMPIINHQGLMYDDDEFVEIVIHELIHLFIGEPDNHPGLSRYWEIIRSEFPAESIICQNHIILYAIFHQLTKELSLPPPKHPEKDDYRRALEIVKQHGSDKIIAQFRQILSVSR